MVARCSEEDRISDAMNCAGQPIFAQLIYLSCASAIGRAACRDMWTVRRERLCTFIYLSLDPSLSAGLRAGFRGYRRTGYAKYM